MSEAVRIQKSSFAYKVLGILLDLREKGRKKISISLANQTLHSAITSLEICLT